MAVVESGGPTKTGNLNLKNHLGKLLWGFYGWFTLRNTNYIIKQKYNNSYIIKTYRFQS